MSLACDQQSDTWAFGRETQPVFLSFSFGISIGGTTLIAAAISGSLLLLRLPRPALLGGAPLKTLGQHGSS